MSSQDYELYDIDTRRQYGTLDTFLNTPVSQFYVEFLQQGGEKPHVVLHLNIDRCIPLGRSEDTIKGCLLGMEYEGGEDAEGFFNMKLVLYNNSSNAAAAGFQFGLSPRASDRPLVLDLINILRGQNSRLPEHHHGDLTRFNFVQATSRGDMDGCRDVISQWMIRLNDMNVVGWTATGMNVNIEVFQGTTITYEFQDLIGNNYILVPGSPRCRVIPMPLNRGIFLDPRVRRIERHGRYQLPYVELAGPRRPITTNSSRSIESGQTRNRHRRDSPEVGGQTRRHRPESGQTRNRHRRDSPEVGGRSRRHRLESGLDEDSRSGNEGPERSRNRHADATTGTERSSHSPDRNLTSNRDRSRRTNVGNGPQADRLMAAGFWRASQARRTFGSDALDILTQSGWSRISGFEIREIDGQEAWIHRGRQIWVYSRDL